MVKKSTKLSDLEFQRKEIEAKIKMAQQDEALRIGLLAIKAGLHTAKLSNSELLVEFKNLASRFSDEEEKPTQETGQNVDSNKDGRD